MIFGNDRCQPLNGLNFSLVLGRTILPAVRSHDEIENGFWNVFHKIMRGACIRQDFDLASCFFVNLPLRGFNCRFARSQLSFREGDLPWVPAPPNEANFVGIFLGTKHNSTRCEDRLSRGI
jgi:hypothetical protein